MRSFHSEQKIEASLNDWIQLRGTPYALEYFPDDFDEVWAHIIESEIEEDGDDQKKKWHSDYLDLMEYKRNPNYGKSKCFYCLPSPVRDDPIFIGINRLVAKDWEITKMITRIIQYSIPVT